MKRGILWVLLLSFISLGGVYSAYASDFSSTNFKINGSLGDSAAGGQASTNYQLTSSAGESIAGKSSSPSYRLGQGFIPTLENSIQVNSQPSNVKAYWPLDNVAPGANAFDATYSPSQPGVYSAGSTSVAGKIGTAWSDTGGNDSVTIPDGNFVTGNAMSVSAWIQPSSLAANRAIVTKWDYTATPTDGEWALQTGASSNQLRFYVGSTGDSGNNYVDTTNANLTTAMTHIAVTYDGTAVNAQRVKIYVNGVQTTTTVTGTIPTSLNTTPTAPITIGDFPGQNRYWRGSVDELKYFSATLSSQNVKSEYDATNAGIPMALSIGSATPGTPIATDSYVSVLTDAPYTLAINQNTNLTKGLASIPGIGSSIGAPAAWVNGTTKGLGFSLAAMPTTNPAWNAGSNFAAIPNSVTSFYTSSNISGGLNDVFNVRYKLDITSSQESGDYTNQVTYTGTIVP